MEDNAVAKNLQGLAKHIEANTPEDSLHILMIVPSGEADGRAHYISNAERPSVIEMLRAFADALEGGSVSDDRPSN